MRDAKRPWTLVVIPTLLLVLAGGCGNDDGSGDHGGTDPASLPAEEVVQQGCAADADCPGGRCVEGLPGGLCTANCSAQGECPEGTICTDTEAVGGVCLFPCTSGMECVEMVGAGYTCDTETDLSTGEDVRVCIDA